LLELGHAGKLKILIHAFLGCPASVKFVADRGLSTSAFAVRPGYDTQPNQNGSSDFGVINKILKKQYDMPINHLADYKIITTFSFL